MQVFDFRNPQLEAAACKLEPKVEGRIMQLTPEVNISYFFSFFFPYFSFFFLPYFILFFLPYFSLLFSSSCIFHRWLNIPPIFHLLFSNKLNFPDFPSFATDLRSSDFFHYNFLSYKKSFPSCFTFWGITTTRDWCEDVFTSNTLDEEVLSDK